MTNSLILAFSGSFILSIFHGFSHLLRKLPGRHVATLNSVAGGTGLAYVFLYLLFELVTEGAPKIHAFLPLGPAPIETVFILLVGALSATYMVQMKVESTPTSRDDYQALILLFLIYNVLAGAGVAEEALSGLLNLAFFVTAIGIHLVFNDLFLLNRHPAEHAPIWRVPLAVAPMLGCGLALGIGIPSGALYIALTLVAGGTITMIFQRELPEFQTFQPIAFMAGILLYACIIFATWRF